MEIQMLAMFIEVSAAISAEKVLRSTWGFEWQK
jgi:hypothetical protein